MSKAMFCFVALLMAERITRKARARCSTICSIHQTGYDMRRLNQHTPERITAWASAAVAVLALLALLFSILQTRWQLNALREETAKQLTELRDEEKIKHLVDEVTRFEQPALLQARKGLAAKRMDTVHETLRHLDVDNPPPEMWDILNFCDHVGLLTHRGYLDVRDVWSELGYWLLNIYADARPVIDADTKNYPASMHECAWLIEAMRPIEAKENSGADDHPSQDDLYIFYDTERVAAPEKRPSRRGMHK
jgi:hypothetical protein